MIENATLAFDNRGIPFSAQFDDIYHSDGGAIGQIEHVFLAGNGLPQRWQGRERFGILETGFGLGLNFLQTWACWRQDALRCAQLHFISVEKYPFSASDLQQLHRAWPQFAEQSTALIAAWPALQTGQHHLYLDGGAVQLTLLLGDALEQLPQLNAAQYSANAIYLDGFAPSKNPAMWSAPLFQQLARLAAPDCTLATWSAAGNVRQGLAAAGFSVQKVAGFASKRHMLIGQRAPTIE